MDSFNHIYQIIKSRKESLESAADKQILAEKSYVASLLLEGSKKVNRKIVEEAYEVAEVSLESTQQNSDKNKKKIIHELSDLWFHQLVLMVMKGISPTDIEDELIRRMGVSGIDEKNNRNRDKDKDKNNQEI